MGSDYEKQTWLNGPGGGTPVNAARLTHLEDGVSDHDHDDAATDVDLAAHALDTTGIHGIPDTAGLLTASGHAITDHAEIPGAAGTVAIYISDTAPETPTVNVVWIDTSGG